MCFALTFSFHFIFKTRISNCLFHFLRSNGDKACYKDDFCKPILDFLTYYARLPLCLKIYFLFSFVIFLDKRADLCTKPPTSAPNSKSKPPTRAPNSKSSKMTKVVVSRSGGEVDMMVMEVPPEVSMSFSFWDSMDPTTWLDEIWDWNPLSLVFNVAPKCWIDQKK